MLSHPHEISGMPSHPPPRLSAKVDPTKLPRLCSFMIERAKEGRVDGQGLLALAEGLLSMGRQPFPSRPVRVEDGVQRQWFYALLPRL